MAASNDEKDKYFDYMFTAMNDGITSSSTIMELIKKSKYNVNDIDSNGETLLHFAALTGNYIVAKYLINECKININIKNNNGITELHRACEGSDGYCTDDYIYSQLNTIKLLLKSGADINAIDICGYKPIHIALIEGNLHTIKLLVKYGSKIDEPTQKGEKFSDILQWTQQYDLFEPLCKLLSKKK